VHDYLFPIEVVRFAFIAGVVASMLLYERRHLTTGSIVVPGYIAVFLAMPSVIVATALNATISFAIVNRVLPRWFFLYGRAKFTILALISIAIQTAMLKLSPSGPWLWESDVPLFVGAGYVVPALIAHDMGRQGVAKTAKAVLLAAVIVALPIGLAVWAHVPGVNTLDPLRALGQTRIQPGWMPMAVLFSASAAWAVARNYDLRAGGFVGAGLVATFAVNPWQILVLLFAAIVTHHLVTRVLMIRLILFGRRKFASMLLLSSTIVWATVWIGENLLALPVQRHFGMASLALTPLFLPGLLANDMQRSSIGRTLQGNALAATFVLTLTWSIQTLVGNARHGAPTFLVALVSSTIVFFPQLRLAATTAAAWVGRRPVVAGAEAPLPSPISIATAVVAVVSTQLAQVAAAPDRPTIHDAAPARRLGGRSSEKTYRPRHLTTSPDHGAPQHAAARAARRAGRANAA